MQDVAAFWDRIAPRYAKRPIGNPAAYEATLDRVRAHLGAEDRVLEIGCGTGSTALLLASEVAEYEASDVSEGMIGIARAKPEAARCGNLRFTVARIDALPEGERDTVLAFNLLHLVPETEAAVAGIRDRLKPGGLFISKTPCLGGKPWLRPLIGALRLIGKAPYVRFFTVGAYDRMIREAGFEIVETGLYPASSQSRFVVARKV